MYSERKQKKAGKQKGPWKIPALPTFNGVGSSAAAAGAAAAAAVVVQAQSDQGLE